MSFLIQLNTLMQCGLHILTDPVTPSITHLEDILYYACMHLISFQSFLSYHFYITIFLMKNGGELPSWYHGMSLPKALISPNTFTYHIWIIIWVNWVMRADYSLPFIIIEILIIGTPKQSDTLEFMFPTALF